MSEATIDEFMASLVTNGEKGGWTSHNVTTGAYGKWQVMPTNWRNWSAIAFANARHPRIWSELRQGRKPVADKATPPQQWWPSPTQRNQTAVARWRIEDAFAKHGNWQDVAAMWESGNADPAVWRSDARAVKYVNRVCVPLGYAEIFLP